MSDEDVTQTAMSAPESEEPSIVERIQFFVQMIDEMGTDGSPILAKARTTMMQAVVDFVNTIKEAPEKLDTATERMIEAFRAAEERASVAMVGPLQKLQRELAPLFKQVDPRDPDAVLLHRGKQGMESMIMGLETMRAALAEKSEAKRAQADKLLVRAQELLKPLMDWRAAQTDEEKAALEAQAEQYLDPEDPEVDPEP